MISEQSLIDQYRENVQPLYTYVSRRTGGDRALTEDLVQETWLRALSSWRSDGVPRKPMAWLTTVASNLLASHYRRLKPRDALDPADLPDPALSEPPGPEAAAMLHAALEKLRPRQVRLLEAFHFDGKTLAEIAGDLGISERAAEGRLHRARIALKSQFGAEST